MILLFLYRKSTVRWNTALRRFWPCAVLLFILLAVSAAGASARLALQDGEEILPLHPRQCRLADQVFGLLVGDGKAHDIVGAAEQIVERHMLDAGIADARKGIGDQHLHA